MVHTDFVYIPNTGVNGVNVNYKLIKDVYKRQILGFNLLFEVNLGFAICVLPMTPRILLILVNYKINADNILRS